MPTTTAQPEAKRRVSQRQRKCSRSANRSQNKSLDFSSSQAIAPAYNSKGSETHELFANPRRPSRITGITQNLWASRTVTQVIGTATTVVTQLYPTPLSWLASYDNRNRLISFNRRGSISGFTYDANSNRLSAINKTTSDTDLDNDFGALDTSVTTSQDSSLGSNSNQQLGFSQTLTRVNGTRTLATTNSTVNYALDANGNLTSDGLRAFEYDPSNRHSQTNISKDGEASKITYLHNGLGQRTFKSEPQVAQTLPDEATLGTPFIAWLKTSFAWLFATAQTNATLGDSFVYADSQGTGLPSWALLGEYGNGGANSTGRTEHIWLPTEDGNAIPIGIYRSAKLYAVHSDHLGTPRLITDNTNKAVWQWPYSAFGDNKPTGVLSPTASPTSAYTQDPSSLARLQATTPAIPYNPRFPGQYFDTESNLSYNYYRNYQPSQGRYTQNDPIGLDGGWNRFGYVEGNPLSFVDPLGLASIVVQGGGSYVPGIGGEGNVGAYISAYNGRLDVGLYWQGGMSVGAQVPGASAQIGIVKGDVNTIRGVTKNLNVAAPLVCGTAMTDDDRNLLGVTLGAGSKLGGSLTYSETGAWSLSEALGRWFDRALGKRR